MKKQTLILPVLSILGAWLMYKQSTGINYLLFNVLLLTILYYFNRPRTNKPAWFIYAGLSIFCSVLIVLYGSKLALFATVVCQLVAIGKTVEVRQNHLLSAFHVFLAMLRTWMFKLFDFMFDPNEKRKKKTAKGKEHGYKYAAILLAVVVAFIFLGLYAGANPLFADLLDKLNFDFFEVQFLFSFFAVWLVFYALSPFLKIRQLILWDLRTRESVAKSDLIKNTDFSSFFLLILFSLLNLMLLLMNILDFDHLFIRKILPAHLTLSDFVHQGSWALVSSLVLAYVLIEVFYRPKTNKKESTKIVKFLMYAWIFQNLFIILSTAIRNVWYVQAYQLTYLRIGVFVFLILAFVSLFFMAIQLQKQRKSWYLIHLNLNFCFVILLFSSAVNWDKQITTYNLKQEANRIDLNYLLRLSEANIPLLIKHQLEHPKAWEERNLKRLKRKIKRCKERLKNSTWRSYSLRQQELKNNLTTLKF